MSCWRFGVGVFAQLVAEEKRAMGTLKFGRPQGGKTSTEQRKKKAPIFFWGYMSGMETYTAIWGFFS